MGIHRVKHTFTAGELSPLMEMRTDFERHKNGCRKLRNMVCQTQGPATRRPGFRYIYDLGLIGLNLSNPQVRMIPFIFNENQAYAMIFYRFTDGTIKMVLGTGDGLVVYAEDPSNPGSALLTECPPGIPVGPLPGAIVSLDMPAGFDIENFDWAQSADEMYIAMPNLRPFLIRRYSHECWVTVQLDFTAETSPGNFEDTMPVDWSDVNGWPEKVTFHQQRLVYGANLVRPQTVWMSQAGDFLNFYQDTANLTDEQAITFTLDSGTQNRIQWLLSAKALNIGTLGNEWTVTGSTEFALTPSNVLAQRQTNNGSEPTKPLMVGITTLFIERHGRTVNEFVYDYTFDSYKTSDMAILSPHITEHYSIVDWTYQQTPDNIIWCIREDGRLIGITYQRQHKVIGWHQHPTTGQFKAITSIPGDTREDDVWTISHRVLDGQDKYYVEKMADFFKEEESEWGRFLDSHAVYIGPLVDSLSGLDHLANVEVDILADGTVHPVTLVASDGTLQLDNFYSHVVVGLGYMSEVHPFVSDIQTELGTTMGRTQRVTNLDVDFYRTLGVYIGVDNQEDGEHEEERAFRVPSDLMGEAVPLYEGIAHYDFPEGFDRKTHYFIRQYQPLPLTVRGVVDTVEVLE